MFKTSLLALVLINVLVNFEPALSEITFIEVKYPLLGTPEPPGSPWPKPKSMTNTNTQSMSYLSKKDFKIESNVKNCDVINKNIELYMNILFPPRIYEEPTGVSASKLMKVLDIQIKDTKCPGYPNFGDDESYKLQVQTGQTKLTANTVWGALRGLETFSQLFFITNDGKHAIYDSTLIDDEPRFEHRGMLLDTARHFMPVPILKKQIDAMAYHKLNVFHWHIVDDQSFPFESLKYPSLTEKGRYSPAHVYSRKDVKDIIDHARLRGIRVIPEFDTPGHVDAFGRTFPQFITVCWKDGKPYQAIYSVQGEAEILNPTMEGVYPIIRDVLQEYKDVFPDEFIHLGMDEVYYECWKSNPNISEWMRNMNFTDYHQLEAYYSTRALNIAKDLGKKVTVWQDVFDNGVAIDKTAQIQIWKDTLSVGGPKWTYYLNQITAQGYKVILSSPWYINFLSYGYQEWFEWYNVEPFANFTGTDEQKELVVGGEICLWAEYVDGGNIAARLWPRASTIAERLWSPASVNNAEDAKFRLDEQRCRLLRRGIPASPVLNGYCGDYEYGMEKSVIYEPVFNHNWPKLDKANGSSRQLANVGVLMAFLLATVALFLTSN